MAVGPAGGVRHFDRYKNEHADVGGRGGDRGWCARLLPCGVRPASADHYVQAQVRTSVDGFTPALMARKDSSATLTYYELQLGSPSGDSLWLLKIVAGAGTVL